MENYIPYTELAAGSDSVVYKGRKKGQLSFVALISSDKFMKPFITNHVHICSKLHHPNIVSFYEWYETNSHLWCVVELCTGGSLQSLVEHDNGCPEELVRRFGWDLVKGLQYIHKSGIVVSYLNPSKILLDGSGILKFSNFCLSKTAGENWEDLFAFLSLSEKTMTENDDAQVSIENIKKKLQGPPAYSAPEVLQGSVTSVSSDLWALGCLLYYMYTGKTPLQNCHSKEAAERILHLEQTPLKIRGPRKFSLLFTESSPSPPSDDFKHLLKGLLENDPDERMKWPELLTHPFWTPVRLEEEDPQVSKDRKDEHLEGKNTREALGLACSRHASISKVLSAEQGEKLPDLSGMSETKGEDGINRKVEKRRGGGGGGGGKESEVEDHHKQTRIQQPKMSITQDTVSELQPKSSMAEEDVDTTFTIRIKGVHGFHKSHIDFIFLPFSRSCSIPDFLNLTSEPQVHCTMNIIGVKYIRNMPIMDDLQSLSDENWTVFISEVCSALGEQNSVAQSSSLRTRLAGGRSRLHLLCYLCSVVQHEAIANRLINSKLVGKYVSETQYYPPYPPITASYVFQVVSTLSELLKLNFRNKTLKLSILATLGEFLHLISSQEKKRGSPEGLWFVPAAAYTGLMRSLREGTDTEIHLMAVKAIENITTTVTNPSHHLLNLGICSTLWYLFTHSNGDAVKVAAASSLSRLVRVVPTLFLSVIDACGPAAISESLVGAGATIQQHLLTVLAGSLLSSCNHIQRFTQKECVLKVLQCLESHSSMTKAKASLLLLLLIQDNTHTLLYCCEHRLVLYIEREMRSVTRVKKNLKHSSYLSECLNSLVVHLSNTASLILEDTLSALQSVTGKKDPDTAQCKKLKQTVLRLSALLDLLLSQVFRAKIVSHNFLTMIGLLLNYITSVSRKANLLQALGVRVCEEFIKTSLAIVEVLSQHHALTGPHHAVVVSAILPPLTKLVFSKSVEVSVFVLRVLSELSLLLLVQESDGTQEIHETHAKEGTKEPGNRSQIINVFSRTLFPRYESLLKAADPIPLHALKLLVSMTEHSTQICSLIKHSEMLPMVFQVIMANTDNVNSGVVQNAVALLGNLGGNSTLDLEPNVQKGLIEVLMHTLSEAAVVYLEEERRGAMKLGHLVLQALLELLHSVLQETVVVCSPLQSQRPSCPTAERKAAEDVFLQTRPLSQLSTHLIHMLSTEKREVWEESLQCLSLLVRLYGGAAEDCLTRSCLQSFLHVLRTHLQDETTRSTLEIINCLVKSSERSEWVELPEGTELKSFLRDVRTSDRFHDDVVQLAAEIHQNIQGS
ncbi:Serine/threonine-protein kinase ULK4 [Takifugu flavidus]|uniref:Serine/threonine-protein kinase ULK4 n=1 Tax=Takifugu flavidus TaxID=433684 RepID=A0A5C6PJF8_9TELE|nr:Serine/threonine-protein kinase ULK4 [Takifugu flavidus]